MITFKCLEEQLYQILEKLKGDNDEYISSAINPEGLANASGTYFEQQFVIKQQEVQSNISLFQHKQYRDILRSRSI